MADPPSRTPALAVGLAVAWAAALTRSRTAAKPKAPSHAPTPAGLGSDLPQQAKRLRKQTTQTPPNNVQQVPTQAPPQPPFLDRIRAAYSADAWLANLSVKAKFSVTDTGLVMMGPGVCVPDAGWDRSRSPHSSAQWPHDWHCQGAGAFTMGIISHFTAQAVP